jgi:CheY-like chemotaxis protein
MPRECVLVVDDDDSIRQIVRLCLEDEGYAIVEAPNGAEALDRVERHEVSLILLDLRMPVMDGREFARLYQAGPGPHAPIVAFVAALNPERECSDLETAGILPKPFDLEDLLHAVRSVLPLPT